VIECDQTLTQVEAAFPLLNDKPDLFAAWRKLVVAHNCKGKVAHDSRLVAVMKTHGVTHIISFNVGDFARYPGVTVLDPNILAASAPPLGQVRKSRQQQDSAAQYFGGGVAAPGGGSHGEDLHRGRSRGENAGVAMEAVIWIDASKDELVEAFVSD